ncbi:MAG: hypothetical protein ABSD42_10520 [Candidatus Bathyarchaeia archaeon]|jgi:hypothetical protein
MAETETDMWLWKLSLAKFGELFETVSRIVPLRKAITAQRIESRMDQTIDELKNEARTHGVKAVRENAVYQAQHLNNVMESGFDERSISEAIKDPNGIINFTLNYGREEAQEKMRERVRSRVRSSHGYKAVGGRFRSSRTGRYY